MKDFLCNICGKKHSFYQRASADKSIILNDIPEEEREERVEQFYEGKFYLIDRSLLLARANLYIKIQDTDESMHWELWVQLNLEDFISMTQNLKENSTSIEGDLFTHIPQYKSSKGIKVRLTFLLNDKELDDPNIEIIDSNTELKSDYIHGISVEKMIKWMQEMYHPAVQYKAE